MKRWHFDVCQRGWVLSMSSGTASNQLAGPFDDQEAQLAAQIWGVPLPAEGGAL